MYEMKPEYYIGIDMIDEEHKQLFKYADEAYELLHDEFTPDKYDKMDIILEKLRDYTVKHFADEEQYMESIHYKKMFTQKVQHMEFVQKLDEFIATDATVVTADNAAERRAEVEKRLGTS